MKNKRGYLLIEFLISIAIFVIFFTAISKLQVLSIYLKDLATKKLEILEHVIKYIEDNKTEKKISACNETYRFYSEKYAIQEKDLLILQKFKFKLITDSGKILINKPTDQICSIKLVIGEELAV
ncbi:MAG: prepilin-type N-terminal cleavage/methylation domain-containing protein [Candidatus Babeliales bacterium]